jgi:hypothetical protein
MILPYAPKGGDGLSTAGARREAAAKSKISASSGPRFVHRQGGRMAVRFSETRALTRLVEEETHGRIAS